MFEPCDPPRVFYLPPGVDFPREVVRGLDQRLKRPEDWPRLHLLGNAERMLKRLRGVFEEGPARLLPKLMLVTDLTALAPHLPRQEAVPELRRQLDLAGNLRTLTGATSPFDIARALAVLIDEMDSEGVAAEALEQLDVSDKSGHWKRALEIVKVAAIYKPGLGPGAVARAHTLSIIESWRERPPPGPVIVAGSTGSRGTTSLLMEAVATLPQGTVILPGFDPHVPADVWADMAAHPQEDHPQYRYAAFLNRLGIAPTEVSPWSGTAPANEARSRLISLALRPAPVTHHWLSEGPSLGKLDTAASDVTLIKAQDQESEAAAIALGLRNAVEQGRIATLISPDRTLTRRVAAALARWDIVADDSAGAPLSLTPPGRLLLQLAALGAKGAAADTLIALLKHPLVATGAERGDHLLLTRALELQLRRKGPPFPTPETVLAWGAEDETRDAWSSWLAPMLAPNTATSLPQHLAWLEDMAEMLTRGPEARGPGGLWDEAPGRKMRDVFDEMTACADASDLLSPGEFVSLLGQLLGAESVTVINDAYPGLMIWGTLEARAQGSDLLVLGGLNEGVWPAQAPQDPWMNRAMRAAAGLLSPERQIGLSAHDFQQAACAGEVWLTRATKSDDAETVPSRWLNRITTLLEGLPEQGGPEAHAAMVARGKVWLDQAARLDLSPSVSGADRPSPVPPVSARPRKLSVTEIRTLIRDPYAIYAKHVLRLRELDPLAQSPDARLRGIVLHDVMEQLIDGLPADPKDALRHMSETADRILATSVPWPAARVLWKARFLKAAPWFIETDQARRVGLGRALAERQGTFSLRDLEFTLTGKADRIDIMEGGQARVYDYKTGSPPSPDEQRHFDKQLPLEAIMIEDGAFKDIGARPVERAAYIGLGSTPREEAADLGPDYLQEFRALIAAMLDPDHGFTARRAMQKDSDAGPYDLLARFGEWGPTDTPKKDRL
ncbi:MAG: double-strand break repair protein AddB [Pseudomonadota bacterium]